MAANNKTQMVRILLSHDNSIIQDGTKSEPLLFHSYGLSDMRENVGFNDIRKQEYANEFFYS